MFAIRSRHVRAAIGSLAIVSLGGALAILVPTVARSAVQTLTAFTCHSHLPCLDLTNTSPAKKASAIMGQVTINTNKNPLPTYGFLDKAGVKGVDTADLPPIGIDTNAGVIGTSLHGNGVVGATFMQGTSPTDFGVFGVFGVDGSKTLSDNQGVSGFSYRAHGIEGFSNGDIKQPNCACGVQGNAPRGVGVIGTSLTGLGVLGISNSHRNAALYAYGSSDGPLFVAADQYNGKNFYALRLDNAGNLTIGGSLTTDGGSMGMTATANGNRVVTYGAQQSMPSLEDVGESRLIAGRATVRLDPTFASAIDARSYLVFITPQGDTSGLYVTAKTPVGFTVREHAGASNVAFDYRIVAHPLGSRMERLPRYVAPADDEAATVSHIARYAAMQRMPILSVRP